RCGGCALPGYAPGWLSAPVAALHQPEEGWLDPGHAVEGKGRDEALLGDCGQGDFLAIGLVNDDGLIVEMSANLEHRPHESSSHPPPGMLGDAEETRKATAKFADHSKPA